ncbi:hypothetical protein BRC92_02760 [Halobacteriales archaeon QS_4_69_31]|nr:MAG: hypothetical protein BRC92_02760 [Halobacteriales archaeon QS_4_69_31]
MDTEGEYAPATAAAARERYEALGPTAQVVVTQVAKAMEMDADEYDERVTGEVVETAREALFASLLSVRVGTREEYEAWLADNPDYEVQEVGSDHVDNVAWHAAPATGTVVAATFQDERRAAVGTLRRQAFGRVYRDLVADGD